jgi:hypothetical protein
MIKIIIFIFTLKLLTCQIFDEWMIATDDSNIKISDLLNFDVIISINKVKEMEKTKKSFINISYI